MDRFLSCDWGTSSFRLRLVQANGLKVIAEVKSGEGISATYKAWEQGGDTAGREAFYTSIIQQQVTVLAKKAGVSLQGIPVILSGMASSTIGLIDLPYKPLPFNLDGSDLEIKVLNDKEENGNPLIIVSGACTTTDAIRGEETKTIGCSGYLTDNKKDILLILPGTHPKHIAVTGNKAINITTFMTGEFFDLLATKSVLAASIQPGGNISEPLNRESFISGVNAGRNENLLHAAFMVRTNQVLKHLPKQQNFYYLSGLLIGAELKDIQPGVPVYLIANDTHMTLYTLACEALHIALAGTIDADEALIKGQQVIFSKILPVK